MVVHSPLLDYCVDGSAACRRSRDRTKGSGNGASCRRLRCQAETANIKVNIQKRNFQAGLFSRNSFDLCHDVAQTIFNWILSLAERQEENVSCCIKLSMN